MTPENMSPITQRFDLLFVVVLGAMIVANL